MNTAFVFEKIEEHKRRRRIPPPSVSSVLWEYAGLSSGTTRVHTPEADLGGGCRGRAPSPEMACGFLIKKRTVRFTVVQNLYYYLISILSSSRVIAQSKAFFFVFAFKICLRQLRHLLVVHPLLRKVPNPPLGSTRVF